MGWCLCTGIWIYFEGLFWPWLYTSSLRDLAYRLFQPFWVRDVPILVLWMMIGQVIHLSHTSLESLGGEFADFKDKLDTRNEKCQKWPIASWVTIREYVQRNWILLTEWFTTMLESFGDDFSWDGRDQNSTSRPQCLAALRVDRWSFFFQVNDQWLLMS